MSPLDTWEEGERLLWDEMCLPKISGSSNPQDLRIIILGDKAFKEVIKVTLGHKGGALTQYGGLVAL